MRCLDFFK